MRDLMLSGRLLIRAHRYRWKLCVPEIGAVRRLLPRGGVGIDVGAHKGGFTWWMARAVGPSGRVIAIEPQRRVSEPTARALAAAGLGQVRVIQAAASDHVGEADISQRVGSTHGASLDGLDGSQLGGVERVSVPLVTVDHVARQHGLARVDLIKIDTEGHERAVLRGAAEVIEKFGPALLVEIEARHHAGGEGAIDPVREISQWLSTRGYSGWFFPASRKQTPIAQFDPSRHQVYGQGTYSNNFLFLRERAGEH